MAWDVLGEPWSDAAQSALKKNRDTFSNGNGSRYDILRETFLSIGTDSSDHMVKAYADAYNTLVQNLILTSGMPEGAKDMLDVLMKMCPLYINSATPEDAVRESVIRLGISNYFKGIYGQPKSKVENLVRAQNNEQCTATDMIFIGDGSGDYKASVEFGFRFIGISNQWNKWSLSGEAFPVVAHVRDVTEAIEAL